MKHRQKFAGASQTRIGIAVGMAQGTISPYMNGTRVVTAIDVLERVADGLAMPDDARVRLGLAPRHGSRALTTDTTTSDDDEIEAVELSRRAAASDIGEETLTRLEQAADELAVRYPVTPPRLLLGRVRRHLGYVAQLLDARKTLDEYRRLLVAGGWLSLLAATLHIDLEQRRAARALLATAATLAKQTDHAELYAWCFETQAWSVLTDGDYRRAIDLSLTAQRLAPRGGSAAIQATAQEGRAWARTGSSGRQETYGALRRVALMVANLPRPDQPEHHYHYDPAKADAYMATTLAWLGDPAAEHHAREVIRRLSSAGEAGGWARRVASANIDLSLALLAADKPDEAAGAAQTAILSGRVVPSNYWRAAEVVRAIEVRGLPEAEELRDAYETMVAEGTGTASAGIGR